MCIVKKKINLVGSRSSHFQLFGHKGLLGDAYEPVDEQFPQEVDQKAG